MWRNPHPMGCVGAERGTRTPTTSRSSDFESDVSTNFTTSAEWLHYFHTHNWVPALTDSSTGKPGSTIGARGLYFCVRDGNRCFSPAMSTGTQVWACIKWRFWRLMSICRSHLGMILKNQVSRPISTGQLHMLPRFHFRPIKQVIFLRP